MKWLGEKMGGAALWKKYRFVLLVLLLGVGLMLLPTGAGQQEEPQGDSWDTFSLEDTERKMAELLSRIQGAGKLEIMLTLKSSSQLYLAEDTDESSGQSDAQSRQETVTLNKGGYEDVVVTRQVYPVYQGAVVVCQGADQSSVRLAITEAVSSLTGLSSDKISVIKWNS